ncbi:MAG: hypothetical protein ACXVJD_15825 [Mucilaginibacter sp.]
MKNFILVILLCLLGACASAQPGSDSIAYRLQRKKINTMLAQRAVKFGQYDQSLTKHTGIFGLQTKKDIRRSNEILMDIVKTDNNIYRELKILLDYRVFQQTQALSHLKETSQTTVGYMTTINKLRAQIDALKADAAKQEQQQEKTRNMFMIALILMLASILLLLTLRNKRKA